jgi:hypothetical protein
MTSRRERVSGGKREGRPVCEVSDVDHGSDLAARGLRLRGSSEPLIQRAAFVHFEVAPTDPAKRCRIDQLADRFPQSGKHLSHPGVEEQRFLVSNEKVIELQVEGRDVDADPEHVASDLIEALPDTLGELA